MRKFLATALLAATLIVTPTFAQEASQSGKSTEDAPGAPIIVEGSREEVRNQIRNLLEPSGGQLSSFGRGFCPIIIGFDAEYSAIIDGYIRKNAKAVGLKPLEKGCSPTAVVIFIDEPQKLVQGLRKKMPGLFETLYLPEIRRITDEPRSTYSWRATGAVGRDGELPTSGSFGGEADGVPVIKAFSSSRLYSPTKYEIFNSYLIMDITRTPGMSLRQIADFATMNLLLDLEEDAVSKAPEGSILKLFETEDPSKVSPGFSVFDRGLLKGLYEAENKTRKAAQQSSAIAREMTRAEEDNR